MINRPYQVVVFISLKTLTSLVMSPKVNLMDSFLQLIIAFGCPKIARVCDLWLEIGFVSRTMKSTG